MFSVIVISVWLGLSINAWTSTWKGLIVLCILIIVMQMPYCWSLRGTFLGFKPIILPKICHGQTLLLIWWHDKWKKKKTQQLRMKASLFCVCNAWNKENFLKNFHLRNTQLGPFKFYAFFPHMQWILRKRIRCLGGKVREQYYCREQSAFWSFALFEWV